MLRTAGDGRRHSATVVVTRDGTATAPSVTIDVGDVDVSTYRASGAGGQHRNKTASAVRLVHRPTATIVTASEDRSQHVNRQVAWERLQATLDEQARTAAHTHANTGRAATFGTGRTWVWRRWDDTVTGPDGDKMSMRRALAGRIGKLLDR